MYLKRLEIVGFKSFADAFELEFRKGISCIVGPNGCGKSNIADAIRWALGSQSPSELRADRMEDVIFSGTVDRKPLGMAEVILTFDNSNRELDLDFDEVSVTRRLFRSGDSEYLLNGNRCRLMDITDLIVDRGLGSNGYWILERNMTETIIESGPTDRRFLFDEAAGIVKYKIQRHRAELKLNGAGADLERLDDIISEVDRNVRLLKKQVADFRRWERSEKRVTEIQGLMEHRSLQVSQNRLKQLEKRLKESRGHEQKYSASVAAATARLSQARTSLEAVQSQLDREHQQCSMLDSELGKVREQIAVAEERRKYTIEQAEIAEKGSALESEKAENLEKKAEILLVEQTSLESRIKSARSIAEKTASETSMKETENKRLTTELEKLKSEYRDRADSLRSLQEEYADRLRRIERAKQEVEHALERKEELEKAIQRISDNLVESKKELSGVTTEKVEHESRLEKEKESHKKIAGRITGITDRIRSGEMEAGLLKAKIESLRKADSESDSSDLLISSGLSVRSGMGIAVGAWLDSFQDSIICDGRILPEGSGGKRYFLSIKEISKPVIPEKSIWLPDCLEENSPDSFIALLSGCIVAPDRKTATEWFFRGIDLDIVTRDGDLFRKDGLVRLGVPESGGGAIEREALAEEADEMLLALKKKLDADREQESRLRETEIELSSSLEEIRGGIIASEKNEASLQATVKGLESRIGELASEKETLEASLPGIRKASEDQKSEEPSERIEECRAIHNKQADILEKIEAERDNLTIDLNRAVREENAALIELSSLESSLKQIGLDRARHLSDASESREGSHTLKEKAGSLLDGKITIDKSIKELEEQRGDISERREEAEKSRTAASSSRAEWLEKTRQIEDELSEHRENLSSAREERAALSGESETVRGLVDELREKEFVLPEENSRFWDYSDENIEKELNKQIGYRENLGPVNMLAVPEFEEASKRITFLKDQRDDLSKARESLMDAIREINQTAAKKFDETFIEVRKHFKDMFTSLFGGGEADIMALDSEDPLEGGIQIVARPPGKKLENITALSSGERAMTAAALLFALYLVKPSPFCVLDELDAPLDDSNVDNYVNLLKGFVDRTQFVVITHNKRTMEAADRLFGITMAEQGVSSMTSVSLEIAEQLSDS